MEWLIVALEGIQAQLALIIDRLKKDNQKGVHVITAGTAKVSK